MTTPTDPAATIEGLRKKREDLSAYEARYRDEQAAIRRKKREEEILAAQQAIEERKERLARSCQLKRDAKFDKAFDIATERARDSGGNCEDLLDEYFDELVFLIKP